MVKGRPPFSTWRCSNSRRIQRLSFPQPDYGTLGIYTQMVFETRKRPTVRSAQPPTARVRQLEALFGHNAGSTSA